MAAIQLGGPIKLELSLVWQPKLSINLPKHVMERSVVRGKLNGFLKLASRFGKTIGFEVRFTQCCVRTRLLWRDRDSLFEVRYCLAGTVLLQKQVTEIDIRSRVFHQRVGLPANRRVISGNGFVIALESCIG